MKYCACLMLLATPIIDCAECTTMWEYFSVKKPHIFSWVHCEMERIFKLQIVRLFHEIPNKSMLVLFICFHRDTHNKTLTVGLFIQYLWCENKCIWVEHVLSWDFSVDQMNIWKIKWNCIRVSILWHIVAAAAAATAFVVIVHDCAIMCMPHPFAMVEWYLKTLYIQVPCHVFFSHRFHDSVVIVIGEQGLLILIK